MFEKINLKDTTFCIPVCLDSIHRKQNLELVLKYLDYYFDTNIIIGETNSDKPKLEELQENYKYIYYKNSENFFYKTKLLNLMYLESDTPFVFSYDCDALFPYQQIEKCIKLLRDNVYDACFPFKDIVVQVPRDFYKILYETLDLKKIKKPNNIKDEEWKNDFQFEGLALALTRNMILKMGFENENFKSWGPEDSERIYRIKFMRGKIGKVLGCGYHINHFRGLNSTNKNVHYDNNKKEFEKIKLFKTKSTLIDYLESFSWYKDLKIKFKNSKEIKKIEIKKESIVQQQEDNRLNFLDKITFIIPFHYDTDDRIENSNLSLNYLYRNVNANIIIGEMGYESYFQYELHKDKNNFEYKFYDEPIFSKTKLINSLVKEVNTEFFCLHDVDIFLTLEQLDELKSHANHSLIDVIIPYNGLYLEIPRKFKDKIKTIKNIKELDHYCSYRFLKEHYIGTGACVVFRRDSFIDCGMMNQFFKKWGLEDDEIIHRMFTLGKNILRMNYSDPIHHLIHDVNNNDFGYMEHDLTEIQKDEYNKIKMMDYGSTKIYANKLFKENI